MPRNPLTDPRPGDAWMPVDKTKTGVQVLQVSDLIAVRRVRQDGTPLIWQVREVTPEEFRRGAEANGAVCVSREGEPV